MGVFNDIQNALNVRLNSLSSIPTIYWQNDQKEPTAGTNFLRPSLLPSNSEVYTFTNGSQHIGIYQVDIFTALKKGSSELLLIADTIREGFKGQKLTSGTTVLGIEQISMSPPSRVDGWWHCFVEIHYLSVA